MLRSLYSAISGLKNHQVKMDVIGNNIANVNTTGFKRSRVTFSTMLSQTMRGASSPSANQGGTNPAQIGLGSMLGSIDQIMTQGSSQSTGKDTDVMIQGSGFFVLQNNGQTVYSRSGAFSQDSNGNLIDPGTGAKVMGYMWDADDIVPADWTKPLQPIKFALGDLPPVNDFTIPPSAWVKTGVDTWAYANPALIGATANSSDANAVLDSQTGTYTYTSPAPVAAPAANIDIDTITYNALNPDGTPIPQATLNSFSIDQSGIVTGVYSNGKASATHRIGQLTIAKFANDAGLSNLGGNFFAATNNSGAASIGSAGAQGRGTIVPSAVEMSNVDLSQEFTDMIVTQRGFQANSRVITVSDTLLQELIDLKRN